ncbi:MAG: 50S ribosomal protein L20 [Actinomycetota bacterium]|jgi:large subunit ribosomal protein L20|nr:50S ribosomal protein L20 [Actinomycetota bacterium]
MARIKRGSVKNKKHRKVLKQAKGYSSASGSRYRVAKQKVYQALSFSYRDRKTKKRLFRRLWITRINAAARSNGLSYNQFIDGLKKAKVEVNRKMLSELAVNDPGAFQELAEVAKQQVSA